jgi:hypothetical protein
MIIFTPNTVIKSTEVNSNFQETLDTIDKDWTTWTPTWSSTGTQPAIGNGTLSAKYRQLGKIVFVQIRFVAGSTTTFGTGTYYLSYPVTPASSYNTTSGGWSLQGYCEDLATVAYNVHGTRTADLTKFQVIIYAPQNANVQAWAQTAPFTWANGDFWQATGFYEAA